MFRVIVLDGRWWSGLVLLGWCGWRALDGNWVEIDGETTAFRGVVLKDNLLLRQGSADSCYEIHDEYHSLSPMSIRSNVCPFQRQRIWLSTHLTTRQTSQAPLLPLRQPPRNPQQCTKYEIVFSNIIKSVRTLNIYNNTNAISPLPFHPAKNPTASPRTA